MKIRFNYREFLFSALGFFLMIPFFKPNYIYEKMPAVNTIFMYYLYGAIGIIFLYYITDLIRRKKAPSKIMVMITLYSVSLMLSTFLSDGPLMAAVREGFSYMALFALSEILLSKSLNMFLRVITPILNLLIIINFATLLIWPKGMYRSYVGSMELFNTGNNWILGYDNAFIAYVLPAFLFSLISYLYVRPTFFSKIKALIISAICIYTIFSRWHATGVVCMVVFIPVALLIFMDKLPAIANAKTYLWGNVVVFFSFVIFRIQELFSYIIKELLDKDLTFSGRIGVWDLSLKSFYEAPLFGYGIEALSKTIARISINSSHNQYLWIIYRGGLVHFLPFMGMVFSAVKRLYEKRSIAYVKLTAVCLCSIFILWQFESISTHSIMILFVFAYYVGYAKLETPEENQQEGSGLVRA